MKNLFILLLLSCSVYLFAQSNEKYGYFKVSVAKTNDQLNFIIENFTRQYLYIKDGNEEKTVLYVNVGFPYPKYQKVYKIESSRLESIVYGQRVILDSYNAKTLVSDQAMNINFTSKFGNIICTLSTEKNLDEKYEMIYTANGNCHIDITIDKMLRSSIEPLTLVIGSNSYHMHGKESSIPTPFPLKKIVTLKGTEPFWILGNKIAHITKGDLYLEDGDEPIKVKKIGYEFLTSYVERGQLTNSVEEPYPNKLTTIEFSDRFKRHKCNITFTRAIIDQTVTALINEDSSKYCGFFESSDYVDISFVFGL